MPVGPPGLGIREREREREESDARVIERSRDEPELFAVLYDRHADAVHRYAARRLGPEAAEDLMAETFAIAFQRRHTYDLERLDARPWLFGVATNLLGRHRRAEARRFRALARLPEPVEHEEPVADRAVARAGATGVRRELAAALAGLSARHRDVVLLVAWAGLDYEEAAQALGVPVGTIRSRLNRARGRLREALGGSDPTAFREADAHA
ncbi:sigma-70 family RNA polymerase sigma factor [Streptomyces caniscabiei]|uniref:RNA polymerase sigma factor n=1 Tax=Streptomyces caniscabiei TaxID=2746961 RepID=UPI0029A5625B|nr:sigma-70 family RNA polymerase sigma factor [Streptomyces caniscabiei]MDX2599178.1 sigma-70 family RNA polymerase sigma factor [Streptomyces caniscabiei]MDX2738103.1 sigma-70 family RNA polymerase sigma factor [Streptomyces caniscabiei]MDX2782677.1 sigma-70 family RNA polymerase sigma factor [Streptomyces caniscabiei]